MKKGDIVIIAVVTLVGLIGWGLTQLDMNQSKSLQVQIKSEGQVIAAIDVDETISASYPVKNKYGDNLVWIEKGEVFVKEANCKNQLCVKAGQIHKSGQTIVCLPNRVVIQIIGKTSDEVDAISK